MADQKTHVNIVGAGLAGLSAAKTFAEQGIPVRLISWQPSERAQSNLAEGGINAVMDVMGENDRLEYHMQDTMKGGCYMADPKMVWGMIEAAPGIIRQLQGIGVPFHTEDGKLIQRNFGGQKMKLTTYAMRSTGKVLVTALISAVCRYEAQGLVKRLGNHCFEELLFEEGKLCGVQVFDRFHKKRLALRGPVLMACGGMNGMMEGSTTGTTANTGAAAAVLFAQGVHFGNLEFMQYHPTTIQITGKRLLVSEAARGEGGRLFCLKGSGSETDAGQNGIAKAGTDKADNRHGGPGTGERCYFMEEKYGERGNLMPRDVISREMSMLNKQAYLDLTVLDEKTWKNKLADLRKEVLDYMGIDAAKEPVPVSPGIHYFMGGILVDEGHRTNIANLYAAGECACAYHGANRLGGNSLLGAIYGGSKAAGTIVQDVYAADPEGKSADPCQGTAALEADSFSPMEEEERGVHEKMTQALLKGMEPLRTKERMEEALEEVRALMDRGLSQVMKAELLLAEAMLLSALNRKETRGAHTRLDYPDTKEEYRKTTVAGVKDGRIEITYEEITPYSEA